MKQHTVLKTCYGKSENAVHNQIYLAMITYCLTLLMKNKVQYKGTILNLKKYIASYCLINYVDFIQSLFAPCRRRSKGRKKYDHDKIFKEIVSHYEID